MSYSDLENTPAKCRSHKTANIFSEAIRCYNSGAYRAATILCWNAIVVDLLEKLAELSQAGEPEAETERKAFFDALKAGNYPKCLSFEKNLPEMAVKYEIISRHEQELIERIQKDRNYCAHPNLDLEEDLCEFESTLVKAHLIHAFQIFFSRSPYFSGRVTKVIEEWLSRSNTAQTIEQCEKWLRDTGVTNIRKTSIAKIMDFLLKNALFESQFDKSKILNLIEAYIRINSENYLNAIIDRARKLFVKCYEEDPCIIEPTLYLIYRLPHIEQALAEEFSQLIKNKLIDLASSSSELTMNKAWYYAMNTLKFEHVYLDVKKPSKYLIQLVLKESKNTLKALQWAIKIYCSTDGYPEAWESGRQLIDYAQEIASDRTLLIQLISSLEKSPRNSIIGSTVYGESIIREIATKGDCKKIIGELLDEYNLPSNFCKDYRKPIAS